MLATALQEDRIVSLNPADWQGDALGNYSGPRWSYHNARPPAAMYDLSDGAVRWWHDNVYDNAALADPQAYAQKLIGDWRTEFARRGGRSNETDTDVMEWVADGTFPIPQNTIERYDEAARQLALSQGQTDSTDQWLIDYGYAHGSPTASSGNPSFYSGALIPPIPGSDVLTGQANVPSPANSGPASNNAYPITLGAPNVSVNMGAPLAGTTAAAAAQTNWLLIAAVAVGVYLLMGGNK